ncbi:MAG: hypothetical protein Q9208_004772 [Pyrenodesmia sp. 3 TL-2023]
MHLGWPFSLLLACISDSLTCVALPLVDSQSSKLIRFPFPSTSDVSLAPTQRYSTLGNSPPARRHSSSLAEVHPEHVTLPRQLSSRGGGGSQQISSTLTNIPGYDVTTRLFLDFGLIVPVVRAAEWMTHFFELVAQRIELGYWAHEPPSHRLLIQIWDFELEFYSTMAVVPWNFVQGYALEMLGDVARGFTGVYHEYLVGTVGGVVGATVVVKFRMMRE